jgi:excisionase family DNA binding protein
LTVAEVAAQQHVHRKTVLRWIADGRLPAQRIGYHWRIRRTELERMMSQETDF